MGLLSAKNTINTASTAESGAVLTNEKAEASTTPSKTCFLKGGERMIAKISGACTFSKPCPHKTPGTKTCYFPHKCAYKKLLEEAVKEDT